MPTANIKSLQSHLNTFLEISQKQYAVVSKADFSKISRQTFDPDKYVVLPEMYYLHFLKRSISNVKSINYLLDLYIQDPQTEHQIGLILRSALLDLFYIFRLNNDSGSPHHENSTAQAIETDYAEYRISFVNSEIDRLKKEVTETSQNKMNSLRVNTLIEFGKLYLSFEKNNFIRTPKIKKTTFGEIKSYLASHINPIQVADLVEMDENDSREFILAITERYEIYNLYQNAGGATPRHTPITENELFCHMLSSLDFIILGTMTILNRLAKYGVDEDALPEINNVFEEVYTLYEQAKETM